VVAPLEHRDTEPLESVITSLQDQILQEGGFQKAVLWKLRILEGELHYCQRQAHSFSTLLAVPREIIRIEKEDQALDQTLSILESHLESVLLHCEDEDLQRTARVLLADLAREQESDAARVHQEQITRILKGYVDTGMRYQEQCQSRITILMRRVEQLGEELALSRNEERKAIRICELSTRFEADHPGSSYGDFRAHVLRLLGTEMEKELKQAIDSPSP
jgi:hypothetical protein